MKRSADITLEAVNAVCLKYGVPDMAKLAVNPGIIPVVAGELGLEL